MSNIWTKGGAPRRLGIDLGIINKINNVQLFNSGIGYEETHNFFSLPGNSLARHRPSHKQISFELDVASLGNRSR